MSKLNLTRRDAMFGAAGLAVAATLPVKAKAQVEKVAPVVTSAASAQVAGFYRFKIGTLEAMTVADGALPQDDSAGTFAAGADKTQVQAALDAKFLPNKGAHLHCNGMILKSGSDTILFDCGGKIAPTSGKLVDNLKAAGIEAKDVTKVMISHAHPDHIFGAVDEAGQSVFKNATFMIAEDELAYWLNPDAQMPKSLLPAEMQKWMLENIRTKLNAIKPQIQTFKAGADLGAGVTALSLPGHTAGHSGFMISSGSEQLLHFADTAHLYATALPHPEWKVLFDYDADQAVTTRKKLFDQLATDKTRAFGYHFPYPGLGHVGRTASAYGWEQELWMWDI